MKAREVLKSAGALALLAVVALVLPAAAAAEPPTVSIDHPVTPSITTAPVSGHVDVHGVPGIWAFEVSTDGVNWSSTNLSSYTEASGSEPVSGVIEGLRAETEYFVRLSAFTFEESITYYSSLTPSFKTDPAPNVPSLALEPPSAVTYTGAHLSGSVNPEEGNVDANVGLLPILWELQYAPPSEPENWQPASAVSEYPLTGANAEGTSTVPVEADASGLKPGTEYAFRLVAHFAGLTVATPEAGYGHFTTNAAAKPTVSGLAATETSFSGFVNPGAPGPAPQDSVYETHWEFTCSPGCSFEGPNSGTLKASNLTTEVTAVPAGPLPNQTYDVTLHATNGAGEESETLVAAFHTPGGKPTVEPETLWEPTDTSIQLNAAVNPHNDELTDCHFEYGIGKSFDHSASCEAAAPEPLFYPFPVPSDNGEHVVGAKVTGLLASTEYRFRLVTTNSSGTTEEDPQSFTTLKTPATENCGNEAIREAQHTTGLPNCRAYERVTPEEKGHGDIVGDGGSNVASTDGNAVSFNTRTPFGDTIGSGVSGQTQYIARRGPEGWSSHAITPQPRNDAYQTFYTSTKYQAFSDDLRRAVVWGYDFPAATGDVPLRNNIYSEDTTTHALQPVTMYQNGYPNPLPHPLAELAGEGLDWGISADAGHVAFVSHVPYLPEAASNGEVFGPPNVYQWDEGVLHLAGVLPDGTVPPEGSEVVTQETDGGTVPNYRENMSADGSRLLFTASLTPGGNKQLFQRIDNDRTVRISESELSPSDPEYQAEPVGVQLRAATPDGRTVLFTTDSPLTSGDTNGATDLYRWSEASSPPLTKITLGDGFSGQVIGSSEDGDRIYYQVEGGTIFVWDRGATRLAVSHVGIPGAGLETQRLGVDNWGPGYGRVSPDGRFFAFGTISSSGIPSHDVGPTGRVTNSHRELYLYDLRNHSLRCVSCASSPASSDANVAPNVTMGAIEYTMAGIRPRFLANDGHIFFSSPEALVPEDTNGVADAYEYDPVSGTIDLLSSGRGSQPTDFVEADSNGNNVFLLTRQRLLAGDNDDLVDLYDARVDGGITEVEEPAHTPCQGEGCQASSSALSLSKVQVDSSAATAGNVRHHRSRRCRHGRVVVHRGGRIHCVLRSHKRHSKANTSRGANR